MKELAEKGRIQGKPFGLQDYDPNLVLCQYSRFKLSGHKSVTSLNHYKKPSLEQQRSMSTLLSNCHAGPSRTISSTSTTNQQSNSKNRFATTQGLLSYTTFSNCTVNISLNTYGHLDPPHLKLSVSPQKHPNSHERYLQFRL